jgi:hypothetical protein
MYRHGSFMHFPSCVLYFQSILYLVGFEVLTAVSTKMAVFRVVAPEDSHLHLVLNTPTAVGEEYNKS